jgi:hypothetical protein
LEAARQLRSEIDLIAVARRNCLQDGSHGRIERRSLDAREPGGQRRFFNGIFIPLVLCLLVYTKPRQWLPVGHGVQRIGEGRIEGLRSLITQPACAPVSSAACSTAFSSDITSSGWCAAIIDTGTSKRRCSRGAAALRGSGKSMQEFIVGQLSDWARVTFQES